MLYTRKTFDLEYPIKEADVVFIGLPFDSTEIGRPCRLGPLFIREALKLTEGFDPETGKNPLSGLKFADVGDIDFVPGNWKLTQERIHETIKEIKETNPGALLIGLGGDHLNTLGLVRALKHFHKNLTIVHFDAHRDLLKDWLGESDSHITWAHHACSEGMGLVQIGCRAWKPEEQAFMKKHGIKETLSGLRGKVYITIDLDVLDPCIAPEVGTPECQGMALHDLWAHLKSIFSNKGLEVVGLDVMECASDRPYTQTALAAAGTIKKALAYSMG